MIDTYNTQHKSRNKHPYSLNKDISFAITNDYSSNKNSNLSLSLSCTKLLNKSQDKTSDLKYSSSIIKAHNYNSNSHKL